MRTISTLERDNEKMTKQLDKLTVEVMELRRTGTPRPSTEPLFELLGTTREEALGENKSTEAHWDYLLSHAVKMKERVKDLEEMAPNDDPYFVGLGQGEDVSTATAGRLLAVAALTVRPLLRTGGAVPPRPEVDPDSQPADGETRRRTFRLHDVQAKSRRRQAAAGEGPGAAVLPGVLPPGACREADPPGQSRRGCL